jgi:hypothetical protein
MKKSVLHTQLVNWPVARMSKGEHGANSGMLDDKTENFIVVNAGPLCEAMKKPTNLVSV